MIPGDVATKTLENRKAREEEAALQRKESQLRNLFDAHIGSRQARAAGSTFLTQRPDDESDSEGDSIKRLVALHPGRSLVVAEHLFHTACHTTMNFASSSGFSSSQAAPYGKAVVSTLCFASSGRGQNL